MDRKLGGIAALLLLASSAFAQEFDVKGVAMGDDEATVLAKLPGAECKQGSGGRICFTTGGTLAGRPMQSMIVNFVDGRAWAINAAFSESDFSFVADALRAKFGEPASEQTEQMQNRMGASFENRTLTWGTGDEKLSAIQRFGRVDRSVVQLVSDALLEEWSGERSSEASDAAKDL